MIFNHEILSIVRFEALTGYNRDDVIGQSSLLFVFPSDLPDEQELQEDCEKCKKGMRICD